MAFVRWAIAGLLLQSALLSVLAQEDAAEATQVAPKLELGEVKLVVKGADGSAVSTVTGSYPKQLLANPQVPASASVEVTVTVKKGGEPFKPQQVMLMARNKALDIAAYAVGKLKSGAYTISISSGAVEKQIGKAGGEYDVTLLVGDPSAPEGIRYPLGTAELLLAAASTAPEPAAAVRTAAFQPVNNLKPEIAHIFRAPEKRPPAIVSYVFTALALVPLAVVLLYVPAATGINFKAWSVAPLYALLFHAGLGGMLLLYVLFWLRLNLAQTLPLAGLAGLFVAGSGYLLLSALSAQRLKKE